MIETVTPRVGVLETRAGSELAALLARAGLIPVPAPALREALLERSGEVAAFIDALTAGPVRVVILLTGVGVRALLAEADDLGRGGELREALHRVVTVCRGPKPTAALRSAGLPVAVVAPAPYTRTEVLAAMASLDLTERSVGIVHHGEPDAALAFALAARGAVLHELSLYEWRLPDDVGPLRALVGAIVRGEVDAVVFTSQVQVRHLFRIATDVGQERDLAVALASRCVVASIGPTCSAALAERGISPSVVPSHPKMGHLVRALAARLGAR